MQLKLDIAREERELRAIVDEYIELKACMQRMRALFERSNGRAMHRNDESALYKKAEKRRGQLSRAFPGRPWAKHPDYLRLEQGDLSVGLAPLPCVHSRPPTAAANMSSAM